jgi:Mg-chelatase subunit ChlD
VAEERTDSYAIEVQQAQPLRAGEVDDNAQWDDYLLYRRQYQGLPVHDRDVSERYIVEVKDGQGQPMLGATVRFFIAGQQQGQEIYEARTYANGQILFHPLALNVPLEQVDHFLVQVEKDNLREEFTLSRFNAQASTSFSERWTVTLDTQRQSERINLDVLFLIDATGSMADEIAKIQDTIFDVAAQIDALPGQPDVRYGMVTYRDRGDAFVTKTFDFTPEVQDFSGSLSTVSADGGGDTPESLNEALHQAVNGVEWRGGETVQLIFLVADAPPHLDYPQDYDYAVEMDNAARRGIKIFPIASSGLDDQGEYIYRQLAQYTQGRFIFLTYAGPTNSGAPGDVTTHHVDDYSVENLDDLLVRLVEEELAYQSLGLVQAQ